MRRYIIARWRARKMRWAIQLIRYLKAQGFTRIVVRRWSRPGPGCQDSSNHGLLESVLAKDWDSPEDAIYDENQHTDITGATATHWSSNA